MCGDITGTVRCKSPVVVVIYLIIPLTDRLFCLDQSLLPDIVSEIFLLEREAEAIYVVLVKVKGTYAEVFWLCPPPARFY